jgi:hypothetical protein
MRERMGGVAGIVIVIDISSGIDIGIDIDIKVDFQLWLGTTD